MPATSFLLPVAEGQNRPAFRWPIRSPRAAVLVVHGLAEHGGRYDRLATALNSAGYEAYALDLPGHGSSTAQEDLVYFADDGGWRKCLEAIDALRRKIAFDHPDLPIFILGHSMGSLLTQQLMSEQGAAFAGVVLSGSNGPPSLLARAGRWIARVERRRLGARGRSALIQRLSFGAYNKPFRPTRTKYDWLSGDAAEVDRYLADSACGFNPTVQLWIDLLDALDGLTHSTRIARIPKYLPIYVIAGDLDPVSSRTTSLQVLLKRYQQAGLKRVSHRFYPGARHELFNEKNREEVTRDLIAWLDHVVAEGLLHPPPILGNGDG